MPPLDNSAATQIKQGRIQCGRFVGAKVAKAIAFGWYVGLLMFGDKGYELNDRYLGKSVSV